MEKQKQQPQRLQSLDALRGFDMLFIMGGASLFVALATLFPNPFFQAIAGQMVAQHERLEKPCRVGEMPFGGRSVGHRLRARVGVGKRRDKIERQTPGLREAANQFVLRIGAVRSVGAADHIETIPRSASRFRVTPQYGYSAADCLEHLGNTKV